MAPQYIQSYANGFVAAPQYELLQDRVAAIRELAEKGLRLEVAIGQPPSDSKPVDITLARKLTSMDVSLISNPNSPLAQARIFCVNTDFGHGYARAEVKYVARCLHQVSSVSLMSIVEDSLPVLEQTEILPAATQMINGCN